MSGTHDVHTTREAAFFWIVRADIFKYRHDFRAASDGTVARTGGLFGLHFSSHALMARAPLAVLNDANRAFRLRSEVAKV